MSTIHVYCSYRLSPVGYQYGVLRYPVSGSGDYCALAPPEESPATRFVKTVFHNGFITSVRGKIPGSDSYIFLVKHYSHSYPKGHADIGKDVAMNMAFEFNDPKEYARFATSFHQKLKGDEAGLKLKMADMIHPDYAVPDYALNIDRGKLDEFMSEMLDGQPDEQPLDGQLDEQPSEETHFSVLSATKDHCNELKGLFGLKGDVGRDDTDEKAYVYPKKQKKKVSLTTTGQPRVPLWLILKKEVSLTTTGQPRVPLWLILILALMTLLTLLGAFRLFDQKKELPENEPTVSVQEEVSPDAKKELPDAAATETILETTSG